MVSHLYDARIIDNGRCYLFNVECPTEVMAAFERLHARVRPQDNGDVLLAWVVTTTLMTGDTEFGAKLLAEMEGLGWGRPD